jgi:arginine/lysine/ornithine decarboxylase
MDHSRAPVLEAIARYRHENHIGFIPPGHKQGRGVDPEVLQVLGPDVFSADLIKLNGLDDREMSGNVIARAEDLMADDVGADRAYFSTCGSSLSVKTCIITVAAPGERLLVSRNAQKSVVAGLIISGVDPVWVHPRWDRTWEWAYPPGPDEVEKACRTAPDTKGMLLITPTDYGTCADIRGVADVCHAHDKTLIVDEAWGAHLPFPGLPAWAMDAGADLCVTSVHKTGAGLEQSSVYHLRGDRVDPSVLAMHADLLDTTSPSSLIYGCLGRLAQADGPARHPAARPRPGTLRHHPRTADGARPAHRVDRGRRRHRQGVRARSAEDRDRPARPGHLRLHGRRVAARELPRRRRAVRPPADRRADHRR